MAHARLEYLRAEPRRRPTPGAIRQLALRHLQASGGSQVEAPPEEPPTALTEGERAANRAQVEAEVAAFLAERLSPSRARS